MKYRFDLTRGYNGLASTLIATGKPQAALDLLRGFIADNPSEDADPDTKIRIALFHSQCESVMARALWVLGRRDEAITLLRHVESICSDMDRREPGSRAHRSGLLHARVELGLALREVDPEEAGSILTLAEARLAASSPRDPVFFLQRIAVRAAIGEIQPARRVDFHARAMADLNRAVAAGIVEATWLERELGLDPLRGRADFRDLQARVQSASEARFLTRRAGWDEAEGRADAASEDYRRAAASVEGLSRPSATDLYNLGCYLAQSGRLARPSDRGPLADRAMDALNRASAAGFRNLNQFRTDSDLNSLRARHDFQLLLLDQAFPARPFAGK